MNAEEPKGLRALKDQLRGLLFVEFAPEVVEARNKVRAIRAPKVKALKDEIERLQKQRPEKKPRWPEDCAGPPSTQSFASTAGMKKSSGPAIRPDLIQTTAERTPRKLLST